MTLGVWVLAFVLAFGVIATLLELTSEGSVTSNPESERGYAAIGRHFPPDPESEYVNELVLVRSEQLTVADPAFRRKVAEILSEVQASGVAHNATSYYESGDASLVSPSRRATLIPVGIQGDGEVAADELIGIVEAADDRAFDVTISGEWTFDHDLNQILDEDLKTGEFYFGMPAAFVILVLVFGALVAAVLPLLVAIFSIVIALALSALVGQVFDLSVFLVIMLTVMGLAVATDYALFVLSRYREERATGRAKLEAIAASGGTASRAVVFSGMAFVLAMSGLLLIPDTVLRSLGVGAITVGLVSMIAALTLLPALLGLLGDRVNALRIPLLGRSVEGAGREGRFWAAVARAVMRRPVVSIAVTVALLLAAAAPVLDLRLSTAGIRSLPDGVPSKEGFIALEEEFGVGTVDSVLVAVEGDVTRQAVRGAVDQLVSRLGTDPIFREPEVNVSPDRQLALVEALLVGDSRDRKAIEAVERIRGSDVPAAFDGVDAAVYVTGETAEEIDYRALTRT
jgi:RND superfamily putative drug exporter